MPQLSADTALGRFTIEADADAITALRWGGDGDDATPLLREAARQLAAYAAGGPLQQAVMREMRRIPFGETRTYGEIARAVDAPAQAVGQCCGANPIPVVIPCHRVTGTGKLGGFSAPGGVESKVKLLRHEGAYSLLI